ncbi:hypothetical protein KPH14_013129, partial [Odynerus spinipes]
MRTSAKKVELILIFFVVCVVICLVIYNFRITVNWISNAEAFNERQVYYDTSTPEWTYEERTVKLANKNSDSRRIRTIHYRSKLKGNVYGSGMIASRATTNLGFARKLKRYERQDVIYVPEISKDSVKCDAWMNSKALALNGKLKSDNDETQAPTTVLHECEIEKGETACFKCIESRKFLRSCVHIRRDMTVTDKNDEILVIPKNRDNSLGWCLPKNFENIDQDLEGDDATTVVPKEINRNCNPNTGRWLLSQLGDDGGSFDSSYNWICKCTYPNLMTNLTTSMSDCLKPVGCAPHGHLDDVTSKGLVDPYREGQCVCDRFYEADFEDNVGPICSPKNIGKSGKTLHELYKENNLTYGSSIPHSYVSKILVNSIDRRYRGQSLIPNPCKVDAITGLATNGCQEVLTTIDGKSRVICVSVRADHVAVKNDSDYLLNNNGQFPNACVAVIDYRENEISADRSYENLPMVLSGFNRKWLPDFGVIVTTDYTSKLRDLYNELWENDDTMRKWYDRNVNEPKPFGDKRFPLSWPLNRLDSTATIVVYEDFPNTGKDGYYSPAHSFIFNHLHNGDSTKLLFTLFAQNYDKFYREYYGVRDYWWWEQYRDQYNRDKGPGRLLPGATTFEYIRQNKEVGKQVYRLRQWPTNFRYNDQFYPGKPYDCLFCDDTGSKSGEYVKTNVIPSLVPFYYESRQRPIYMNGKYFSFDATVIVNYDPPVMNFVAERFMHNYKNHHYLG